MSECNECGEMRETVKRLNRRAQDAEAAIADAQRCIDHLSKGKPWCGGNLGRALLAYHCIKQDAELTRLRAELAESRRRCGVAEAIVAKLPKTADGVPVTPNSTLWCIYPQADVGKKKVKLPFSFPVTNNVGGISPSLFLKSCYSTEAAARAALAELERGKA